MVVCPRLEPRLVVKESYSFASVRPTRLGGECGPCPVFVSNYALAFALQLRKITVNLGQGIRKVLGL
jgi:hypothetical protein